MIWIKVVKVIIIIKKNKINNMIDNNNSRIYRKIHQKILERKKVINK